VTNTLVSVVMPVWRPRADWLHAAVASVLGQRGCELEFVVVDDGSPEPVGEMLADVDDPRLRVLRVEHGGVSRARNAGTAATRGTFVRFVDADDVLALDSTARLASIADARTIAYASTMMCDDGLRPRWRLSCSLEGEAVEACLLGRFTVRLPSLLFPREAVDAAGAWDPELRVSEDWDFVLRALEHARIRGTRDVATYYRRHGDSATAGAGAGAGAHRVVDKYFERHPERRRSDLARCVEARLQAHAGRAQLSRRAVGPALRHLARSVALDPTALAEEVRQALPALLRSGATTEQFA
jgi:glycosyltransferase involved in cell wall biosynthesis